MHVCRGQIRMLYVNFAMVHYPAADDASQLMYAVIASEVRIELIDPLLRFQAYALIPTFANASAPFGQ